MNQIRSSFSDTKNCCPEADAGARARWGGLGGLGVFAGASSSFVKANVALIYTEKGQSETSPGATVKTTGRGPRVTVLMLPSSTVFCPSLLLVASRNVGCRRMTISPIGDVHNQVSELLHLGY
jgi:hypothetical protein